MVITTILLAAMFLLFAAISGLIGFGRGIVKQSIRAVMMVISFVCAIYFAKLCTDAVMVWMDHKSASDILDIIDKYNIPIGEFRDLISYIDPSTLNYVLAIPLSLFISPIAFPLFFVSFQLLMLIPYFIICGSVGLIKRGVRGKKKKKKRPIYSWAPGLALGALQGVIMLALIISPIAGILSCSTEIVEKMEEEAPDMPTTETISNSYDSWVKPWAESPVIKGVATLGGSRLYRSLSTVKIDGEKHDMFESLADPSIKVAITVHELWGWDWTNPTPEEEDAIRGIIDVLDDHPYATGPILDVIEVVYNAHEGGALPIEIDGDLADIVAALFGTLGEIDSPEDLKADVATLADVYFFLAENGVLEALVSGDEEATTDALTATIGEGEDETTVISVAVRMLNSNPHTQPLVTAITKLTISSLVTEMLPEGSEEIYENIKDGAEDILAIEKVEGKEEEYKAEVAEKLDTVLKDNNIEVDKEIVDEMAGFVSDNYDELQKKLEEHEDIDGVVNDIIISYYDAYIKYLNSQNQTPPEIPEIPEIPGGESSESTPDGNP